MEDKPICLISGAAGMIGSHLAERLLKDGHIVIGIDDYSTGKEENISHLLKIPDFLFFQSDIRLINDDSNFDFDLYDIDTLFHLAANSDISIGNPVIEYRQTLETTFQLLEYARWKRVKNFVFASSGAIYGEAYKLKKVNDYTINENFGPLVPISYYGAAKLASEALISAYSANNQMRSFICRLPNVIGSHATHGILIDFLNKIKKYNFLEVLGDGTQQKPYMHFSDVIEAMIFVWQNAKENVNIYNISGPDTISVKEIAELFVSEVKPGTMIAYKGGDRGWIGDSPKYFPDVYRLKELGYSCEKYSKDAIKIAINEIVKQQ